MPRLPLAAFLLAACFLFPKPALPGENDSFALTRQELKPRTLTLKNPAILLSAALAVLQEKTGNTIADRRRDKSDPMLSLDLDNVSFWPALESIARAAGCGISLYQHDGAVALVNAPHRPMPLSHSGIFRFAVKRLAVSRDEETGTSACTVLIEVAWEPRFVPLYLTTGPIRAAFSPDAAGQELRAKLEGRGRDLVAGRTAFDLEVRLPAPKRSAATLAHFQGELKFLGPSKMLTFVFSPLKTIAKNNRQEHLEQTQDGVKVRISEVKTKSTLWSVAVEIDNPQGPVFESFQASTWLRNNRITLEKGTGTNRQTWPRRIEDETELESPAPPFATRAVVQYFFKVRPDTNPGTPADWSLTYRTPGRLVELTVPFTFKDLPLP